MAQRLAHSVRSQLIWTRLSSAQAKEDVIQAYVQSLNQIARMRTEVDKLIRHACLANLEFRQNAGETDAEARDAALAEELEEQLSDAACDWKPPANMLNARSISTWCEEIREHLDESISDAAHEFAEQFLENLAKLVDRELIGLVEWLPNQCCRYFFFRRTIIQDNFGTSRSAGSGQDARPQSGQRSRSTSHGVHYHRFARHEHDLMNVVAASLDATGVKMLPQVLPLVNNIPTWLRPFVQVIDGQIIRERITEREQKTTGWGEVQSRDEPIYGDDPGVFLGPYLLTGWGPADIRREELRNEQVNTRRFQLQSKAQALQYSEWNRHVRFLLTPVAGVAWFMSYHGWPTAFIALCALAAAIVITWQAARDRAIIEGIAFPNLYGYLSGARFTASQLLAIWLISGIHQPVAWSIPHLLLVILVVCHIVCRRLQSSTSRMQRKFFP